MTDQQKKALLYAQQGELDAVAMYNALAKKAKDPKDAATFKQLASEEGRHAAVFHRPKRVPTFRRKCYKSCLSARRRVQGRRAIQG